MSKRVKMDWKFEYSKKELFKELKKSFEEITLENDDELFSVEMKPVNLYSGLKLLKEKFQFLKLVDVVTYNSSEIPKINPLMITLFILERPSDFEMLYLKSKFSDGDVLEDFSNLFNCANWYLREINEFFGIKNNLALKARLLTHDKSPLNPFLKNNEPIRQDGPTYRKFFKIPGKPLPTVNSDRQWFNYGPSNIGPENQYRLLLELREDMITEAEVEIGFSHIGLEKKFEELDINGNLLLLNKYKTLSENSLGILYCKTIEEIFKIEITDRVMAVRMLYLEIDRIYAHLTSIYRMVETVENHFVSDSLKEIIKILHHYFELLEVLPHQKSPHLLGGLTRDIKRNTVIFILQTAQKVTEKLLKLESQLIKSRQWMDLTNTNHIKAEDAVFIGLEGPNLRASGVKYDLRKNVPYYLYDQVEFQVPLGVFGNTYDRWYVRVKEIYESIGIVSQILDNIPSGPYFTKSEISFDLDKRRLEESSDYFDTYVDYCTKGPSLPIKEHFSRIENPRGTMGLFIKTGGNHKPARVKLAGPSFKLMSGMSILIRNENIKRLPTLLKSFDINIAEVDR